MELSTQTCIRCSKKYASTNSKETLGSDRKLSDLYDSLSSEIKTKVDALAYESSTLAGILILRDNLPIGLKEGMDLFTWRVEQVKKSSSNDVETLCSDCNYSDLFETLSPEIKTKVDSLAYENTILAGIMLLIENLPIDLKGGIEMFTWRVDELRKLTPDKFKQSPEKYWDGFYS